MFGQSYLSADLPYELLVELHQQETRRLENLASEALVQLYSLDDRAGIDPSTQQRYQSALATAQATLETHKNNPPIKPQIMLSAPPRPSQQLVDRSDFIPFTDNEVKEITEHCNMLPDKLKKLVDAAISDDTIELAWVCDPAFILREGRIYAKNTLLDFLKGEEKAIAPMDQDLVYTKADIIPCNTLKKSMSILLKIIRKDSKDLAVPTAYPLTALSLAKQNRAKITTDDVALLERLYLSYSPEHQALFNCICRDPITGYIMDDPVLLPDGYVYDRTTAHYYLNKEEGRSPLKPSILFKADEITRCYFVEAVLDELKTQLMAVKQPPAKAQVNISNPAPSLPSIGSSASQFFNKPNSKSKTQQELARELLSAQIRDLLIALDYEVVPEDKSDRAYRSIKIADGPKDPSMQIILRTAMTALESADMSALNDAMQDNKEKYNVIKTTFNGTKSLSTTYGKFSRKMGTSTNQPGWHVEEMLKKVVALLNPAQSKIFDN